MGFLKFAPSVYIVGDEYEICVAVESFGLVTVKVGEEIFYEDNNGVLPTEKLYAKIRIPEEKLNAASAYTIIFRKTEERKNYWSRLGEEQRAEYSFKAPKKGQNINIYHISDVHYRFDSAKKVASYFGDDIDLYVFNGDIGEVQSHEDYLAVAEFVGEIAGGRIPVIFVRGNHDTRGYLPEKYTDYFPANGKKTYFTAKVGDFNFLCLDLGEDKVDEHEVYGGFNNFHAFRLSETEFLRKLVKDGKKFDMAICHIAPAINNALAHGDEFDIEGELYKEWLSMLSELGVKVMLSGHMHEAQVYEKNDKRSMRMHDFPIIVGAVMDDDYRIGAALTFSGDDLSVKFTDRCHEINEEYKIHLPTGSVKKY